MRLNELVSVIDREQYIYINFCSCPSNKRCAGPAWSEEILEFFRIYKDYVVLSIWGDESEDGACLSIDIIEPTKPHGQY